MPSSVIRRFDYAPADEILHIQFVSGRRYAYHGVPQGLAEELRAASSKGEFFNAHIRDQFDFTRES